LELKSGKLKKIIEKMKIFFKKEKDGYGE